MFSPGKIDKIRVDDGFWSPKIRTAERVGIPYMHRAFNNEVPGVPKSHCLHNFRVAAGLEKGRFGGAVYQDSDLYKYIEAVGCYLACNEDPETEASCDAIIGLIERAQLPDGYVNTYFILNGLEQRWNNLAESHELYCAGHLMEAACAYYTGTGKKKLLEVARRFADCIDRTFGPGQEQNHGHPGHQEIEIGLLRLFEVTGERRYRELAAHFLYTRGQSPLYFDSERKRMEAGALADKPHWSGLGEPYAYMQAHRPLLEQDQAVGHAVRANYMYTAAAHLAGLNGDKALLDAVVRLWENITTRRMYVTGGVGSTAEGEAYTLDYDLPNDMMYNETCASIGLAMLSMRLLNATGEARYADVMELALYNGVLSGQQLDGTKFFYVNPMSIWRERCLERQDMELIKPERQGWFNCACCPPNILRTLTGLGQYIYSHSSQEVRVNLFVGGSGEFDLADGRVVLCQSGGYPWDGEVQLHIKAEAPLHFRLAMRIPGWCGRAEAFCNGEVLDLAALTQSGYLLLERTFQDGDRVSLRFAMPVETLRCHPAVPFNAGRVALRRGPVVYCLEEEDNGSDLWNVALDTRQPVVPRHRPDLLDGVTVLAAQGVWTGANTKGALYAAGETLEERPCELRFIPYYAWCNRTPGNMAVWVREYCGGK